MSRGWNTPSYGGAARQCRPLFIPDDPAWLAAVGGALAELTKPYNWVSSGGISPLEAAEIASQMLWEYFEGECEGVVNLLADVRQNPSSPCTLEKLYGGTWQSFANLRLCVPQFRLSPEGVIEFSGDGEVWQEIRPPLSPVQGGTTGDDKRCIAANSAAEVLHVTLTELLRQWNAGVMPLAAVAAIIGLIATIIFYAPAVPLVLAFIEQLFAVFAILGEAAEMSATTKEELINILYCASQENDGVVTFNFAEVEGEIEGKIPLGDILDWSAVLYVLKIVGPDGLNRAGATGVVQDGTCDDTNCPPECLFVDFSNPDCYQIIAYNAEWGVGSLDTSFGNPAPAAKGFQRSTGARGTALRLRIPADRVIKRVSAEFRYSVTNNPGNAFNTGIRLLRANNTNIAVTSFPASMPQNQWVTRTLEYAGAEEAAFVELWCGVQGSTSPPYITGNCWIDNVQLEL